MSFLLSDKHVIIYGNNQQFNRTTNVLEHLKRYNIRSHIIVDKNAELWDYTITYASFMNRVNGDNKSDYVFFLNFWDANQHVIIAKKLFSDGFSNIIFLPFGEEYSLPYSVVLRKYYNSILYGELRNDTVPSYDELINDNNGDIIQDYGEYISFWEKIDNLYVMNLQKECDVNAQFPVSIFSDVQILRFKYYMELFDYIYNNGKYPEGYMANSLKGRNEEDFLRNRRSLIESMEYRLRYDWNYFIDSPIFVKKRTAETYTVLDGLHRAFFLWMNGYEKVPVVCLKEKERNG